jgi:hypothetical protein
MTKHAKVAQPELDDAAWGSLDKAIQQLEAAWKSAKDPGFASLVPPQSNRFRAQMLAELIKVDQEHSWRSGSCRTLETYLAQWPELSQHSDTIVDLLNAECETRAIIGRLPSSDELSTRFPREISERVDLAAIQKDVAREYRESRQMNAGAVEQPAASTEETALVETGPEAVGEATPRIRARGEIAHSETPATRVATSARQAPCPAQIGRYKPLERLGGGACGTVYRCRDEQLERDVAIKLFNKGSSPDNRLESVLHEAKSAARLHHPGVVAVLDTGLTDDGMGFVVYDFVRGSTLEHRIATQKLDRKEAVRWVVQIAEALHAAHKCGIVHRDIKPANILIDNAGQAHLTDFGIAKLDDRFFVKDAGQVVGTLLYTSPEQAQGLSHWAAPQSDIYALGTVLYQLLCGRTPFSGTTFHDLREQIIGRTVLPPRTIDDSIPRDLEAICLKALAKKPEERFATAADFAAALKATLAPRRKLSRPLALAGMVVSLLLMTIPLLFWGTQPQTPDAAGMQAKVPQLTLELIRDGVPHLITGDFGHEYLPLQNGDHVRLNAEDIRGQYTYVYWYDADGQPQRLWPEADSSKQAAKRSLTLPPTGGYPVEGNRGTECVLVAVTPKPLTNEQIATLDKTRLTVPPHLQANNGLQVVRSLPGENREHSADRERGLGKAESVALLLDDTGVIKRLEEMSALYYGFLLPHK